MISLQQIEQDLIAAIKAKEQIAVDVLRGLKTRIQNEKISKMKELNEGDITALVKSEVKRRKEAAESYKTGGRAELSDKEMAEADILSKYLPAQMSTEELSTLIDKVIAENNFAVKDFGHAMGKLKAAVGDKAEGAAVAKLLKEKLK